MELIREIATHAANEHINFHCQELEHEAKLRRWQDVYDSLVAALTYHHAALARQREGRLDASAN